MDKAEIRAKAEKVYDQLGHYSRSGGDDIGDIEAALAAAYDQGWNEGVEAAVKACATCHSYQDKGVSACIQVVSRLERGQGV